MINERHHDVAIKRKLEGFIATNDNDGLCAYLDSLSNAQFRTAGYVLAEQIMLPMPAQDFWKLFLTLCQYNKKAFLVTLLKVVNEKLKKKELNVYDEGLASACQNLELNDIDTQKITSHLLNTFTSIDEIKHLFLLLGLPFQSEWIPFLMKCNTPQTYFLLFSSLRHIEHDRSYLIRLASYLIKKGDSQSFNLASVIKTYFDLKEVKGTFSLQLKPYELARLETNYDAFVKVVF